MPGAVSLRCAGERITPIRAAVLLADNGIADAGATFLAEALKSNYTLTNLNLYGEHLPVPMHMWDQASSMPEVEVATPFCRGLARR